MNARIRFPDDFLWGAATSAYQVEGSPLADGAGDSNWHVFTHTPGRTANGETGDVACDHYRRYRDDVGLMRELGLQAYRFSLSWPRILPAGRGTTNPAGLAFYDRLIDLLLEADIQPCVTLFHWDLPAALDDAGGWLNRDSVQWFADYARVAFEAFGDRVPLWATLNEPWVIVNAGYIHGVHPPGHRSLAEAARVSHHLLLAHGAAVRAYRRQGSGEIGIVVNLDRKDAATDAPADQAAARRADAHMNRHYLDPLFRGHYPEELREIFGDAWPEFPASDFELIREPIDFLGVNYYSRQVVRHDDGAPPVWASAVRQDDSEYTEMGWEVHPASFTRVLSWIKERYGDIPIYVTENGAAFDDPAHATAGPLQDPRRVDFLRSHLAAAHAALAQGVDLRGYFVWSLLDNFEWTLGYSKRFGIVHVDFATQKRTPKRSAHFYRDVIRTRGEALAGA